MGSYPGRRNREAEARRGAVAGVQAAGRRWPSGPTGWPRCGAVCPSSGQRWGQHAARTTLCMIIALPSEKGQIGHRPVKCEVGWPRPLRSSAWLGLLAYPTDVQMAASNKLDERSRGDLGPPREGLCPFSREGVALPGAFSRVRAWSRSIRRPAPRVPSRRSPRGGSFADHGY